MENPTGNTFLDEDLSFLVDTTKWDCNGRNLVFLESNNNDHLKYWFGGTCGGQYTRIWIRVSEVKPFSTEKAKMYFDLEETDVFTLEEDFAQKFITMSTGEVCDKKSEPADFLNGTFIRGAPSGTQTLDLEKQIPTINTHDIETGSTDFVTETQSDNYRISTTGANKDYSTMEHFHNFEITFENQDEPPKFRNTLFCSMDKIDSFKEKVAIQVTDEQNSCFTNFDAITDNFALSMFEDIGYTGGSDEHSHELSVSFSGDQYSGSYLELYTVGTNYNIYGCYPSHSHYSTNPYYTDIVESVPEFVKVNLLKQQCENELEDSFRFGLRYLATGIPPMGFEHDESFAEKFFRSTSNGTVGSIGGNSVHKHNFSYTTENNWACGGKLWATGSSVFEILSNTHSHQIEADTSSSSSHGFSYVDLFLLKEKQSSVSISVIDYDQYTELEELKDYYVEVVEEMKDNFTISVNEQSEKIETLRQELEDKIQETQQNITNMIELLKDEIEEEIESMQSNITTRFSELEESIDQMEQNLDAQIDSHNSRILTLENNDVYYSKVVPSNEMQIVVLEKEIKSLENKMDTENIELKANISKLEDDDSKIENEIDLLKVEIEDLKKLIDSLQEQNDEADNKIENIESSSQGIAISGTVLFILLIIGLIVSLFVISVVIALIIYSMKKKKDGFDKDIPQILENEEKKNVELKKVHSPDN